MAEKTRFINEEKDILCRYPEAASCVSLPASFQHSPLIWGQNELFLLLLALLVCVRVCVFSMVAITKLQVQNINRQTSSCPIKRQARDGHIVCPARLTASCDSNWPLCAHVLTDPIFRLAPCTQLFFATVSKTTGVTCLLLPPQLRNIWLRKVPNRAKSRRGAWPRLVLVLVSREDGWRKAECTRSAPCRRQQPTLEPQTE